MTRRQKIWQGVAIVFTLINAGGAVFAARASESIHAGVHVALTLVGVLWMVRILERARLAEAAAEQERATVGNLDAKVNYLQQSADALAFELERIGEQERYKQKLEAERRERES